MPKGVKEILFSEEEIRNRVAELGAAIARDYDGTFPIFIGVLKGSFMFMADIVRSVGVDCEVDFMGISSYNNGTTTTGAVRITKDLSRDIQGRHVIIVEDILDSGVTLAYLKKYLENRDPASVKIVTLLDKPSRRKSGIVADYVGFECPNEFVVGYGLDYAEKYRNLPYVGILKPEVYS